MVDNIRFLSKESLEGFFKKALKQTPSKKSLMNCPDELKNLRKWIHYRFEEKGDTKKAKIPVDPKTGKNVDITQPENGVSFKKALQSLEEKKHEADGLGFILDDSNDIIVIDIDDCIHDGSISDDAYEIIRLFRSYTEISPSGTGVHVFLKGKLPFDGKRSANSKIEVYAAKRYMTVTGWVLSVIWDLQKRQKKLDIFVNRYFPSEQPKPQATQSSLTVEEIKERIQQSPKSCDLFNGSWRGQFKSRSEADLAFCLQLAYWSAKDPESIDQVFRGSKLMRPKWDEKRGDATYGKKTIQKAMELTEKVYAPSEEDVSSDDPKTEFLLNKARELGVFYHQNGKTPWARVKTGNHWELHKVENQSLYTWLEKIYYDETKRAAGSNAIKLVIENIRAQAIFDGREVDPQIRAAWDSEKKRLFYDLCNEQWEAVEIRAKGWKVKSDIPPVLYRNGIMLAQPTPAINGDPKMVLGLINLKNKEDEILFMVMLISWFFPNIPRPICLVSGEKGSGKSTFLMIIKRIVDPAQPMLMRLINSEKEIIEQLQACYLLMYDNLSHLSNQQSDLFCQAITGGGIQKRKLYTDSETIHYEFKRAIGFNGINQVASQPDLLDRSIIFNLERIKGKKRRTETQLLQDLGEMLPEILGGIFDVIVKVLAMPDKEPKKLDRMADFDVLGRKIAKALGYKAKDFIRAFRSNKASINDSIIEDDPLAKVLMHFARSISMGKGGRKFLATELFKKLEEHAQEMGMNPDKEFWPKNSSSMGKRLRKIRSNLEEAGVKVDPDRKSKGSLYILKLVGPLKKVAKKKSKYFLQ